MSVEKATEFAKKALADEKLREEITQALSDNLGESIAAGIEIAKKHGFEFSKEDWTACYTKLSQDLAEGGELADVDLEKVAGGIVGPGCGPKPGQVNPNKPGGGF